ncbi:MAG: oligoendopeptidase F [Anaerolineae bacterium]|nr:oligoendopeptidase F [Anaerolineae bacterium]
MTDSIRKRSEVPQEDRWNVEALYAGDDLWETDFTAAKAFPEHVAAYEGHLGESDTVLAEALTAWFDANRALEKIWVYAHLRSDEDLGNSTYQTMMERARSLYVQFSTASSFLAPEILAIEADTMAAWMEGEALAPYHFWLEDLLRSRPHVLSPAQERLMSMVSEPLSTISRAYSVLKNVDLAARLPTIQNEEGAEQKLTHGQFIKFLESRDRDVRKRAFEAYYGEYQGNRQTIATVLDGGVKTHIFQARARNYGSALEAALFDDKVDVAVYEALIESVHGALPPFFRYVDLRKRLLGVEALHLYDVYVPVVPAVDLHYDYDEAVELVCQALLPLGDEYVGIMREGLLSGWVDRYENVGKRSGAYSSGCYDSMPYVLMNYTGTLDAVFTLAHELGHSMHSWYSKHNQPYHLADYRILVAEVASTTNEALLNHHLLTITEDQATRAYLIDRYLDSFRGTLYRQTMFAEFEKLIHEQVEGGQPLTADGLDTSYYALVKTYFGDSVAFDGEDEPIAWEWARIDHFFYNFYVYKYATGMSSAVAIARDILAGDGGAVDAYLGFLKSGGSDYPLELLKRAGVDLTTPTPVASALAEFERLVGELEGLMR